MGTFGRSAAWTVALAGVVASAAVSLRAHADEPASSEVPDLEEARRLFREAVEADRALDPARALALYQQARAITVSPQLLFNIGSCEERLGRLLDAARSYRAAEINAGARHSAEVEREAKARLAHLVAVTPRLRVVLPVDVDSIEIRLDETTIRLTEDAILVDPGAHRLLARAADDRVFELTFHAEEREERRIEVRFPTSAGAAPGHEAPASADVLAAPPSPPPSYLPVMVGGAATIVLGTVAGLTFGAGRAKKNRYETLNAGPTPGSEDERRQLKDDGEALYVTSTVFGVSAGLAAGTTIVLLVRAVVARAKRSPAALWVAPVASGVRLGGSF